MERGWGWGNGRVSCLSFSFSLQDSVVSFPFPLTCFFWGVLSSVSRFYFSSPATHSPNNYEVDPNFPI